jgi:hypothetical protein
MEMPVAIRGRVWLFIIGALIFRVFNSLHWALIGGIGWGFGAAVGSMVAWPEAITVGGALGLMLVMIGVLTMEFGKRSEYTPIQLATIGGLAAGGASVAILNPLGRDFNYILGGGLGLILGIFSSIMKQFFAPVNFITACVIAGVGTAIFAGIGSLLGGPLGWGAAGGLALTSVALLAELFRREPAVLLDADDKPIRIIPRSESCWRALRQSCSLLDPLAMGWNGFLAGCLGSLWASWITDQPNPWMAQRLFLACGSLTALIVVLTRLELLPGNAPAAGGKKEERRND